METAQKFEEAYESRAPYLEVVKRVSGSYRPRIRIHGNLLDWTANRACGVMNSGPCRTVCVISS